jgi:putative nucleotidyltransferase with HDIG domain
MGEKQPQLDRLAFRVLLAALGLAAVSLLFATDWFIPPLTDTAFWNALAAFALMGIASDSAFLPVPRISNARVGSSVVFIPFLASVLLFPSPWPMVIAGSTGFVAHYLIRRKDLLRALFNTAQYMLFVGLGGLVYGALGGHAGLDSLRLNFPAFAAMVLVFFIVNQGTVALAVAWTTDISIREAWTRIAGDSVFIKLQMIGLVVLVLPLFFVRHMYRMNLRVERANRELLELMVKSIEARDPYTSGHSIRVAEYARQIAREAGLPPKHVDQIGTAALLHDVGKIYEEFAPLLRKEGRLTPEERMLMQAHPVRSAELAGTIAEFRGKVQTDIRNHHENYDGTGYPDGLAAENIPIGARIIMIADTLDAMTTDRPYRQALSLQRALDELARYAGRQFDPKLVELVSRSPAIRRLLGPQLVPEIPSMGAPSRASRSSVRA